MRTSTERRHLDDRATQRHLRVGEATGNVEANDEISRQPHRLHKAGAKEILEGGRHSSNPRRSGNSEKDRLTHAELAQRAGFQAIEVPELQVSRQRRGEAAIDYVTMGDRPPSSRNGQGLN